MGKQDIVKLFDLRHESCGDHRLHTIIKPLGKYIGLRIQPNHQTIVLQIAMLAQVTILFEELAMRLASGVKDFKTPGNLS